MAGIQLEGTTAPYIGLRVDRASGNVMLKNPTASALSFNAYEISSAAGSLKPSEWQDVAGNPGFPTGTGTGNGWEKDAASNENQLLEAFLTGNSSIGAGGQISLGNIFRGTEDLSFRFRTAGGIVMDSVVEYFGVAPTLFGDYNDDGAVGAADYVVWRNTFGQTGSGLVADGNGNGQVDPADYNILARQLRPNGWQRLVLQLDCTGTGNAGDSSHGSTDTVRAPTRRCAINSCIRDTRRNSTHFWQRRRILESHTFDGTPSALLKLISALELTLSRHTGPKNAPSNQRYA